LNSVELKKAILQATTVADYVIVEGNMITDWPELLDMFRQSVFLTISKEECRARRATRVYDPPDEEG